MQVALLLKILFDLPPCSVHHTRIFHSAGNANAPIKLAVHRILHQLLQHAAQRLARPCPWDDPLALHNAAEGCNRADLSAHQALDLRRQRRVRDGG